MQDHLGDWLTFRLFRGRLEDGHVVRILQRRIMPLEELERVAQEGAYEQSVARPSASGMQDSELVKVE